MSEQPQHSTTSRTPLQRGVDWVAKHWPRARLAHEGMMLEKIQRQQRCVEVNARNAMTGDTTDTDGWPEEDDEMGVKIGDEIHHHHPKPSSKILPYVLAAALGATGGGLALLPWLLSNRPEPPAATDQDTTRRVEFEKWIPDSAIEP